MPRDRERRSGGGDQPPLVSNQNLIYVEEAIPKFSGKDATYTATKWAQEVEDNTEIFSLTPIQQLLIARRTLTSTAAAWLRTERTFKNYEELKAALFKEFPDEINTKRIHEMMSERKKRKDESCYDYMLEMKALGKRGRLADYVAIQYIIEGIPDRETNKIMLYGVTTYPDLKEKLKLYKQFKSSVMKESSSSSGEASLHHKKQSRPAAAVRCFSCGKMNHTSAECSDREKGLKCFRCNEFGHIGSHCKNTDNVKSTTNRASMKQYESSGAASGGSGKPASAKQFCAQREAQRQSPECSCDGGSNGQSQSEYERPSSKDVMAAVNSDSEVNKNDNGQKKQ